MFLALMGIFSVMEIEKKKGPLSLKKWEEKKRKEYIVVLGSLLKPGQIETDAYWGIYFCVAQDIPRTTLALSP